MSLTEQDIRDLTDQIYLGLFGKTANMLRYQLGLPLEDTVDDDNLRDHMGLEALKALCEVEDVNTKTLRANPEICTVAAMGRMAYSIAWAIGVHYRADAHLKGIDFLTGRPLNRTMVQ